MRQKFNPSLTELPKSPRRIPKTEGMEKVDCLPADLVLLQGLSTTQLRTIMQVKKVLHRSKCKTKAQMVAALRPFVPSKSRIPPSTIQTKNIEVSSPSDSSTSEGTRIGDFKKCPTVTINGHIATRFINPVMGIDIHKDTLAYAIVNPTTVLVAGEMANTDEGVSQLLKFCQKYNVEMVGMESTSEYWLPVHWTFQSAHIPTLVANPQQTKATQGIKTDPQDAQRIAFALRDGRLKPSVLCTPEQYALRKDLREMVHQINAATAVKNRIQQIFHKARAGEVVTKFLTSNRGCKILSGVADARSQEAVYEVVKDAYTHHRGKTQDPQKLRPLTREVWAYLQRLDLLNDRTRFFSLLEELYAHQAREYELLMEALRYAKTHPVFRHNLELLLSIPCIGLQSATIILAEIIEIAFFPTVKQLTKWAGLVPRTNQSGYKKRQTGHIYKGGNKYLRRAVWLAAQSDYRFGNDLTHPVGGQVRRMIVEKNRKYKQAVTAGAHKLLRVIYGVLKTQHLFHAWSDPEDQQRLVRSTQRKTAELDQSLQQIPMQDAVPFLLERLTNTMERAERARKQLELCYQEVYQRPLMKEKMEMEPE
jgi:transposase